MFISQLTFNGKIIIDKVQDKLNRGGKYRTNNIGKKLKWTKVRRNQMVNPLPKDKKKKTLFCKENEIPNNSMTFQ